jgi:hypothetical protein
MEYVVIFWIQGFGRDYHRFTADSKAAAVSHGRDYVWWKTHLSGKTMRSAKWHVEKVEK